MCHVYLFPASYSITIIHPDPPDAVLSGPDQIFSVLQLTYEFPLGHVADTKKLCMTPGENALTHGSGDQV